MPLTLLAALFLAFGLDSQSGTTRPVPWPLIPWRVAAMAGGVALVGLFAAALARSITWRVRRLGYASSGIRRGYLWGTRGVALLALGTYAGMLQFMGWREVVRTLLGSRVWPVVADGLILLPFLLTEAAGWWALFAAERALRVSRGGGHADLRRHMILKGRQELGLLLPVLLVYSLGRDVAPLLLPTAVGASWAQPAGLTLMAVLVLAGSPLFLRLAWPTHSLPPGPLRDRLERLAKRVGFRCTDILVWDTGNVLVNAGVTGTLPWFRYVLLSDALVENLSSQEIAAVFGHEIGHIAHRHLLSFGLFFLGTIGVMAVIMGAIDDYVAVGLTRALGSWNASVAGVVQTGVVILALGTYFFLAFGLVSRRFERQADLFGCRAVSCGRGGCPPHEDVDGTDEGMLTHASAVCPAGIRTFVNALTNVAALNGMGPTKRSWRHGSIARRVAFLESLEGRPDVERRFQRGVLRLRIALVLVLSSAWGLAVATNWLNRL